MCGRFTLTWDEWRQVSEALGLDDEKIQTGLLNYGLQPDQFATAIAPRRELLATKVLQ